MSATTRAILFPLGRTVMTPAIEDRLVDGTLTPALLGDCLHRHECGDWGTLAVEDWRANNAALAAGERLVSCYMHRRGQFWIITEADRSVTTVLLPEDY